MGFRETNGASEGFKHAIARHFPQAIVRGPMDRVMQEENRMDATLAELGRYSLPVGNLWEMGAWSWLVLCLLEALQDQNRCGDFCPCSKDWHDLCIASEGSPWAFQGEGCGDGFLGGPKIVQSKAKGGGTFGNQVGEAFTAPIGSKAEYFPEAQVGDIHGAGGVEDGGGIGQLSDEVVKFVAVDQDAISFFGIELID